jgi:hypothetical protein
MVTRNNYLVARRYVYFPLVIIEMVWRKLDKYHSARIESACLHCYAHACADIHFVWCDENVCHDRLR